MAKQETKVNSYAIVKYVCPAFPELERRIGQKGKVLKIIKSRRGHRFDFLTLEFDDGERKLFARYELELLDKKEKDDQAI